MILNKITYLFFLGITFVVTSQVKVCEKSENVIQDLNAIGKCAIENFKKSKKEEFVRISTRNRFVRKRNSYLTGLKKNLKNNSVKKVSPRAVNRSVVNKNEVLKSVSNEVKVVNSEGMLNNYIKFDEVNTIPVFVNCNENSEEAMQSCVKDTFVSSILEHLTYPFDAASEGIEGRVWVRFLIDTDGYIKNVTTTGPANGVLLEQEAKRLIKLLPKFVPGKHNDEYVNVEYFVPIDFQLDE